MSDLNRITFTGRLTRQAELKSTTSGKHVCTISVAVDNSYKNSGGEKVDEVCFIECKAWAGLAETISKYTDKGHRVGIDGSLKLSQWEKDGVKHSKHYVLIEKFTFLQPKPASGNPVKDGFSGESVTDANSPFNDDIPF